jgi:Hydrazine synthase alpha subunit middle domain/F5/8 type C domain/WD40-like Beta Propeller Repeat
MMRTNPALLCISFLLSLGAVCWSAFATTFRDQVEADWLLQEQVRTVESREITTQSDAAGACDGVKDGKWGFHTNQTESPWWQVDLGEVVPVGCVVVWNRCDGVAGRGNHLSLLLSEDGEAWRPVYTHDGTAFLGFTDNKPLRVGLQDQSARFVRIQIPGKDFLHLDEVEVFGPGDAETNLALRRPADQSSLSPWSANHQPPSPVDWVERIEGVIANCRRLIDERQNDGTNAAPLTAVEAKLGAALDVAQLQAMYVEARWIQRALTLSDPLLDFDTILFAKRVPGSFNHMSDQYMGWWSRPGGGICLLSDYTTENPGVTCVSEAFTEPGSFMRPMLSYDGSKVLFAWCRHYPDLAAEQNKLDKNNVPEDAFYHVFEINVDGTGLRQLTQGKYDDFDARYLPDGRIVFLSTRRGQFVQAGPESARLTTATKDLPDVYVRCGGGPERPCVVYTLHTIDGDGGNLLAISPFEMFEWTPSVAHDGRILYSRWDYIDRNNMPYMSLWSTNPDGTSARVVFANHTESPHCTFEPRSIPGSNKIIFTASGHHAQTMGSLVLLDPTVDTEGTAPMTRLTPEVPFPEIEAWPDSFFANPWPLSERLYLVSWGCERTPGQGNSRSANAMGLYLFDATSGSLELLYRDADISSAWPIPLRARKRPPVIASPVAWDGPKEGRFLLTDVYRGLKQVKRGDVKALRIVAVPAKTHPTMNFPSMGITRDDPGKCVLGTVPVEADGSAHFRVPSGVIVFFQALDAEGKAIQTMRTTTHVQPGQTLSCAGCHESRHQAPNLTRVQAAVREPSRITVGPEGSWPLRFDRLIQPVLDEKCVGCHNPEGKKKDAAKFNLTAEKAYDSLTNYGKPSLREHVLTRYRQGHSTEGGCTASMSPLLAKLSDPEGHHGVKLDADSRERFIVWMDTYAQRLGSFCDAQEQQLAELRQQSQDLLIERGQEGGGAETLAMRTAP